MNSLLKADTPVNRATVSLALAAWYVYSKPASGDANNSRVNYKAGNAFGVDVSMSYNARFSATVELPWKL
jgi:hypothetical protein